MRPRQACYQVALRPDMKCCIESKTLLNLLQPKYRFFDAQHFRYGVLQPT
jgi:hypothetical protein